MSQSPESCSDPAKMWKWRLLKFAMRGAAYYLVVVLVLSALQRQLMYGPARAEALPAMLAQAGERAEDVSFQTADGLTIHGWHLLPQTGTASSAHRFDHAEFDRGLAEGTHPVVLFFPGNGGNRTYRTGDFHILTRLPAHVIAFDYRGYGENAGDPSEEKLAEDALSAWKYVTENRRVAHERVLIYGESLGGGVATRLAAEICQARTPPGGLILCSTFSSMVDAASYHYPWLPVRLVLKDRYLSINRIGQVTCPILMLHGQRDTIVPYDLGRRLFAAATERSASGIPKTFVDLPRSDHNDILGTEERRYHAGLVEFVQRLMPSRASLE